MIRLYYLVIRKLFLALYLIFKMGYYSKHTEKYDTPTRYRLLRKVISIIDRVGRITTIPEGLEFLPKEGGYIMFSNHQGRYDPDAFVSVLEDPTKFLVVSTRQHTFGIKQIVEMTQSKWFDQKDPRQEINTLLEISKEVNEGTRYVIFPEGMYSDNHNTLNPFNKGIFNTAKRAKCPIVPVCIYDSYKVFGENSLKPVNVRIRFLSPIYYQDYSQMTTDQIRDMVQGKIQDAIDEYDRTL